MDALKLRNLEFVVFDLETTGLYPESGDEIIEIGALTVKNLKIEGKAFHSLIKPTRSIPAASSAVHGIKDKDVVEAPAIGEQLPGFCKYVGNRVLVAHNARFDMSFILKAFALNNIPAKQNVVIDTIALSKKLFPYETSHSLDAVMSRLGVARSGDRHRSIDDCKYTSEVLIQFIEMLEKQGITSLMEVKDSFIKTDGLVKSKKPKAMGLFG